MKRVNHPFEIQPPETDPLEVVDFAEDSVPQNLCIQAILDGETPWMMEWIMFFATRAEYMPPSVIRRDVKIPKLEPFVMQETDLLMREWLLNTAGTFDGPQVKRYLLF